MGHLFWALLAPLGRLQGYATVALARALMRAVGWVWKAAGTAFIAFIGWLADVLYGPEPGPEGVDDLFQRPKNSNEDKL